MVAAAAAAEVVRPCQLTPHRSMVLVAAAAGDTAALVLGVAVLVGDTAALVLGVAALAAAGGIAALVLGAAVLAGDTAALAGLGILAVR